MNKPSSVVICACVVIIGMSVAHGTPPTRFDAYDGMAPDARAIAMGTAFVAVGNAPASAVYNAAGLIDVTGSLLSVTYEVTRQSALTSDEIFDGEALRDRSLQFIGMMGPKGSFLWRPLSNRTDRIENGSDWVENEIAISAVTIAAAQESTPKVATGLSLSYLMGSIVQSQMDGGIPSMNLASGSGIAADLGFLSKASPQLRFGLNLQNIFGMMWWDDYGSEHLPFAIRAGLAFQITDFLIFSSDWEKRWYRKDPSTGDGRTPTYVHFGIEQKLVQSLAVRAGTYGTDLNDPDTAHVSAGLGYNSAGYLLSLAGEKYRVAGADVYRYVLSMDIPFSANTSSNK